MMNKQKFKRSFEMEQDYDYRGDSLFLYVDEDYNHKKSIRIIDDIIMDFDNNDIPVAIELLNASKMLNIKKSALKQPIRLDINIHVGKDVIKLEANFLISIHKKQVQMPLVEEIANKTNLVANETHFERATV